MIRRPPRSPLFPYTPLFRSKDYRTVGAALASARQRAGLTQKQLARLLRKPQSFISNYERGQRRIDVRSEEHTSELQSHLNLVCRLLLEKKKKQKKINMITRL